MKPNRTTLLVALAGSVGVLAAAAPADRLDDVLRELNAAKFVQGTEESKSYRILFDAFLDLSEPPFEIGEQFNLTTIHPKMSGWTAVSGWAESNPGMAEALLKCKDKNIIGLRYGMDDVPASYREADLVAALGVNGSLRNNQFRYFKAVDTIAAFATAEMYRLLEAGDEQKALDLAIAHLVVLRQFADRLFLAEKLHHLPLLTEALANLRDVFYRYREQISVDQFVDIAWKEIPFLRPDWRRFEMPEADRVVSQALIEEVFNPRNGQADPDKFAETFAAIQSSDAPLTIFGAARRWRQIAEVHGSLEASLDRLNLIYDDWWRRWRVDPYDAILELETQFERTNEVRYAAVIYSMQNIEGLFTIRKHLQAGISAAALAAGLCAYKQELKVFPRDSKQMYAQFVRKISDADPYDPDYGHFRYLLLDRKWSIDTTAGRLWVEAGEPILYAVGQDGADDRAAEHTDDGARGDVVVWPPIRSLQRDAGLID